MKDELLNVKTCSMIFNSHAHKHIDTHKHRRFAFNVLQLLILKYIALHVLMCLSPPRIDINRQTNSDLFFPLKLRSYFLNLFDFHIFSSLNTSQILPIS